MKLLRETVRRIILEGRGMFTYQDLPPEACITVKRTHHGGGWWITYEGYRPDVGISTGDLDSNEHDGGFVVEDERGWPIFGYIKIETIQTSKRGNCDGALKVSMVEASDGWGPLLYDCAIEWATIQAGGLIPDRVSVSDEARDVWDYYLNKRTDVKSKQLDNEEDSFDNGPEDDCDQAVARQLPGLTDDFDAPLDFSGDWKASALSKKYTKSPTTINALKERWVEL